MKNQEIVATPERFRWMCEETLLRLEEGQDDFDTLRDAPPGARDELAFVARQLRHEHIPYLVSVNDDGAWLLDTTGPNGFTVGSYVIRRDTQRGVQYLNLAKARRRAIYHLREWVAHLDHAPAQKPEQVQASNGKGGRPKGSTKAPKDKMQAFYEAAVKKVKPLPGLELNLEDAKTEAIKQTAEKFSVSEKTVRRNVKL